MTRVSKVFDGTIARGLAAGVLLASVGSVDLAFANHGATVTHVVTAQQSVPGGISPDEFGSNLRYMYTVTDGDSIVDTLPVQMCLTGESSANWVSVTYTFNNPAGDLFGVTKPANVGFTRATDGANACKTANITVNTGALTLTDPNVAENRTSNVNMSVSAAKFDNHNVQLSPANAPNIQIHVVIEPAQASTANCYLTDGEGMFLADCEGNAVNESGSDDGRFAIVRNKKGVGVATNPGQFYYNVTWTNDHLVEKTVNVAFLRDGVLPKGANAIHAAVFPPVFGGVTPDDFELVNDSLPGGSDDLIAGITVPAGWTLWVNYHVEWDGLGSPVGTCTDLCEFADSDGKGFSISAAITGDGIDESCEAGAWGYLKK